MFAGDHDLLARLKAIHDRLDEHAAEPVHTEMVGTEQANGLSDPPANTPPTFANRSQLEIWHHIKNFVSRWRSQCSYVIEKFDDSPVPFQRVDGTDTPSTIIDLGSNEDIPQIWPKIEASLLELHSFVSALDEAEVNALGVDQDRGVMSVFDILADRIIGHLEIHLAELDRLRETTFA